MIQSCGLKGEHSLRCSASPLCRQQTSGDKTELTRYMEHPTVKTLALSAPFVDFPIAADTFRMLGRYGDHKRRQSFILPYSQDATGTSRTRSS
jgi:hypothetical protein